MKSTPYLIGSTFLTILACLFYAFVAMIESACSTAQVDQGLADAETAANVLETINTDTGGAVTLFTQAAVNKALVSTHNSGDTAIVNAAIAEGAAALKVQLAAKSAGLSSTAAQTATTATLTDPAVIATGAAAAAGPTGAPTTMFKFAPNHDLRAPYGCRLVASAYDLKP